MDPILHILAPYWLLDLSHLSFMHIHTGAF